MPITRYRIIQMSRNYQGKSIVRRRKRRTVTVVRKKKEKIRRPRLPSDRCPRLSSTARMPGAKSRRNTRTCTLSKSWKSSRRIGGKWVRLRKSTIRSRVRWIDHSMRPRGDSSTAPRCKIRTQTPWMSSKGSRRGGRPAKADKFKRRSLSCSAPRKMNIRGWRLTKPNFRNARHRRKRSYVSVKWKWKTRSRERYWGQRRRPNVILNLLSNRQINSPKSLNRRM